MAPSGQLESLLSDRRINAGIGWILIAVVAVGVIESLIDLDLVWAIVSAFVVFLAVLPAVVSRNPRVMVPWEVLLLATLPLIVRSLAATDPLGEVAAYVSVATVALIIAVELDVFTTVKMTTSFAVIFVVITTLATAGGWAVMQWLSDVYFGTTFIYPSPPPVSANADAAALESLMWDFVAATAAGVLAGVVFALYFRERADVRIDPGADLGDDP
ncbi:MAG: hypothetical protein ABEJ55_01315 [Halanaeroarchaeum sp.]